MASQEPTAARRDAKGRFVADRPRRAGAPARTKRRAAGPAGLIGLAERMRAQLEQRLAGDDESLFAGRDNGVALLLKLTDVAERIAALDDPGAVPAAALAPADRAILERYVAWRLRQHGIDAGLDGVPTPEPPEPRET